MMGFGYFPDFQTTSPLADLYLRVLGYPYGSRRNEVRLVFAALNAQPTDTILDIGSGDGIWTNQLARSSRAAITALDISQVDMLVAKKRAKYMGITNVTYVRGDATHLPFKSNTFDRVLSISTLEHTDDDVAILKEMLRVLKPGGTCVISIPTAKLLFIPSLAVHLPGWLKTPFQSAIRNAHTAEEYQRLSNHHFAHQRLYTAAKLVPQLKKIGFKLHNLRYHISVFGLIPHNLVHSLRIFEWKKTKTTSYSFVNQAVFALTFPLFYFCYLLDDFFPSVPGFAMIFTLKKTQR